MEKQEFLSIISSIQGAGYIQVVIWIMIFGGLVMRMNRWIKEDCVIDELIVINDYNYDFSIIWI